MAEGHQRAESFNKSIKQAVDGKNSGSFAPHEQVAGVVPSLQEGPGPARKRQKTLMELMVKRELAEKEIQKELQSSTEMEEACSAKVLADAAKKEKEDQEKGDVQAASLRKMAHNSQVRNMVRAAQALLETYIGI